MKNLKFLLVTVLFFCSNHILLIPQSTYIPAGNDLKSSNGSVSYTIGQTFYDINIGMV